MSKHFKINHDNRKDMETLMKKLYSNCPSMAKEVIKNIPYMREDNNTITLAIHKDDEEEDIINEIFLGEQQSLDEDKDFESLKKEIALENKVEKIEAGLSEKEYFIQANKPFNEVYLKGGFIETMLSVIIQVEIYANKTQVHP